MISKTKIYFFSPFCILRNSTNRIFDMRMNDALAGEGADVTLVFPYVYMKENLSLKEVHACYSTANNFRLRMLYTPLTLQTPKFFRSSILLFAFFTATLHILFKNSGNLKNVIIISGDSLPLVPVLVMKKIFGKMFPVRVVLQLHELKKGRMHRWVYRACSGLMPNVGFAKDILHREETIPDAKMLVMNAPMIDFTRTDCTKEEARRKINYVSTVPLVVYTGKVGKGIAELDLILQAASILTQYHFVFTGGKNTAVEYFREWCAAHNIQNVTWTGFFNDINMIRYYQLAADVLVSYYTSKDHLVEFNYPQKLQEYFSTRNPTVTPDFEATRSVVNSGNAFIVPPDDAEALAKGIREAIENKLLAAQKAEAAFQASRKNTFDYRVKEFMAFFSKL